MITWFEVEGPGEVEAGEDPARLPDEHGVERADGFVEQGFVCPFGNVRLARGRA